MVDMKKMILGTVLVIIGLTILIGLAAAGYQAYKDGKIVTGYDKDWSSFPKVSWLKYIFGPLPTIDGVGNLSPIILIIAIWLLILVTFSDIIAVFSSFSSGIAWIIGFCLATITANLSVTAKLLAIMSGVFVFAGTAAIFIGLAASFVAFVLINWGLVDFQGWLLRRRMLMSADSTAAREEAGGAKIKGVLRGLGEVGKGLKDANSQL